MKLFIMGAGYVGMALLSFFQNQGHEIYTSTTSKEKVGALQSYAQHVFLIPAENEAMLKTIASCDGLIILVAPKNQASYEETYLGTAKMVSSALKNRERPLYLLYTSSTSVYTGDQNEWAEEHAFLQPPSETAQILLETENVFLEWPGTCILRLGGIYGPKRELIDRAKRLSGKEMSGSGEEPTNHIHLEDIVSAVAFCLSHHLYGIYNIVNDDHPYRKELYDSLCQSIGMPPPIWNSSPYRGYKVSNRKIKSAQFVFKHPNIT